MVWHVYANGFKNTQKLICVNCQPFCYFSGWQFTWIGFVYTFVMYWHSNVPNQGLWAFSFFYTSAMVWHVYANGFKNTQKLICVNCQPLAYFSGWQSKWVGFVYTLIMHWHLNVPNRGMWACVIWCTSAMVWHVYANGFKNTQKLICVNCQPLVYFSGWQFKWVGFVYTLIMHWHLNVPNHGLWATSFCHTSAMVWHVYANGFKKYTEAYLRKLPTIYLLQLLAV